MGVPFFFPFFSLFFDLLKSVSRLMSGDVVVVLTGTGPLFQEKVKNESIVLEPAWIKGLAMSVQCFEAWK